VLKNFPANAGDARDMGSIPGPWKKSSSTKLVPGAKKIEDCCYKESTGS